MDVWDQLLMLGGYPEPPDEEDEEGEPGEGGARNKGKPPRRTSRRAWSFRSRREFYLAGPTVLEHSFHAVEVAEEAYDAVINMAVKLIRLGCPLAALEIE